MKYHVIAISAGAIAILSACDSGSNAPALDYKSLIGILKSAGGGVANAKNQLVGKSVSLALKTNGGVFFVEEQDEVLFQCEAGSQFAGGSVTAKIVNYSESEPDSNPQIWLDRCVDKSAQVVASKAQPAKDGAKLPSRFVCRPGALPPSDAAMKARQFSVEKGVHFDDRGENHHHFTLFNDGSALMTRRNGLAIVPFPSWNTTASGYELTDESGAKLRIKSIQTGETPGFKAKLTDAAGGDFMDKVWSCHGDGAIASIDPAAKAAAATSQSLAQKEVSLRASPPPQRAVDPNVAMVNKVRSGSGPYCSGVANLMEQALSLGRMDHFYETLGKARGYGCL
ncbi:hypothetical protein ACPOLB_27160 [Rubrivivax sp. RP6-9]|uniref:hypothetical protein n=1 Tax=Rubrivivax sp. RP6-9 TaxID=3415750 RepID=UPI003CC6D8CB